MVCRSLFYDCFILDYRVYIRFILGVILRCQGLIWVYVYIGEVMNLDLKIRGVLGDMMVYINLFNLSIGFEMIFVI